MNNLMNTIQTNLFILLFSVFYDQIWPVGVGCNAFWKYTQPESSALGKKGEKYRRVKRVAR